MRIHTRTNSSPLTREMHTRNCSHLVIVGALQHFGNRLVSFDGIYLIVVGHEMGQVRAIVIQDLPGHSSFSRN